MKISINIIAVKCVLVCSIFLNSTALDYSESEAYNHYYIPSAVGDTFPDYSVSSYHVGIPLESLEVDSIIAFTIDSANTICDSILIYDVNGMIAGSGDNWLISDTIGNQVCNSQSTPYETMCQLLKFYKIANLDSILSLYRPSDTADINAILGNDSIKTAYLDHVDHIRHFVVMTSLELDGGVQVNLNIHYNGGDSTLAPAQKVEINYPHHW